jgi:DNA primase
VSFTSLDKVDWVDGYARGDLGAYCEGRVYVDCLQNGHGRLPLAPLGVRPLPGAPVSMPREWSQVDGLLRLGRFTLRTAAKWLRKYGIRCAA